ncbi:MAG TPA: alkaline phosphatase PhoX, partial [Steroidobacteraceae bacterium]|nr:alkaline phosphatase PhoX [Steroidobacteraceae bacterium]
PGSGGLGNPGGALVKFIPAALWNPSNPSIASLDQSPWAAGSIYGLRLGRNGNNTDVGQGNEYGRGVWVEVTGTAPINLRAAAKDLKLTSFYRPEDMSVDLKALKEGNVRVCGTNTGQDVPGLEGDNHWGEVYCLSDESVEAASATAIDAGINIASIPEYQPLILGTGDFAMPDNIDIQPGRGLFVMTEDGEGPIYSPPRNNDIWACLDDGEDSDHLSDGCIKAATLNDLTAEPTGGFFDGTGRRYFVSIQHNITGHGVVLEVTGWQPNRGWFGGW